MKTITEADLDADPAAVLRDAAREDVWIEAPHGSFLLQRIESASSPRTQDELESMLLEGLKGPSVPLTDDMLDDIRERVLARSK